MHKVRIELVTDQDCPNVEATRSVLRDSLSELGLPLEWTEWDRAADNSPPHAQRFGSPSVLVDGRDIADEDGTADGNSCRIYRDEATGFSGVPSGQVVVGALRRAVERAGALKEEQ